MTLEDLGYNAKTEKFRIELGLKNFEIGRIISEHRERYVISTINGEFQTEIAGSMRFSAKTREDYPVVGDWVAISRENGSHTIHHIMPRYSSLKRQATGQHGDIQIIAANVDYAFLVQAVDRDFNINRLERYLTMCYSSKVKPIIVVTKIDLIEADRIDEILDNLKSRVKNVPILPISNQTERGIETINAMMESGKTYCMLGSSGVGKSTLLNNLSGKAIMRTDAVSQSTNKGRHVTSHRELTILKNGAILIDNPGMREVGIADTDSGLETTFDNIVRLSINCKFKDCTHTTEKGCSVLEAVENGEIDAASYKNYLKMEREKVHFESTTAEKQKKDKALGKLIRNFKNKLNR